MQRANHYAVVVGISHYPGYVNGTVAGPVDDAKEFLEWLLDPAGGNLPDENINYFFSSAPETPDSWGDPDKAHPREDEIDALFEPFWRQGLHGYVGERLYIFAAGHGFSDPIDLGTSALLSAEATPNIPTHASLVRCADWFKRHAAFDEIVLFADCCRSQLGYEVSTPSWGNNNERTGAHPNVPKVRFLYGLATGYGKRAYLGQFGAKGQRGVFSQTLLRALREAQPDDTGQVTAVCLLNYIYNIYKKVAAEGGVKKKDEQEPFFRGKHENSLFFSTSSASTLHQVTVLIQPHAGWETLVVTQGRNPNPIKRITETRASQPVNLCQGLYQFSIGGTDRSLLIEVPKQNECIL